MGELPNDIRSILEALARKEITVEEAEQLILAIKQSKESDRRKKSKSFIGKEFVLNTGEEYVGNIEIVNGRAVINGKLVGSLQVVFGEVVFSGEVTKNVELVGTTVTWNGGRIGGNLQMVGCNYKGVKPVVEGNVSEVNNFFVSGIIGLVKKVVVRPLLSGIKIED
ncbi:MAG: hypothetical protein ACUVQF_05880 [Fervidobacterium sp.]|uniref:hypothetical protein n=1 Tax=Fervidobacterium sp. TaxID=1871331 RepID=UPI00404A005D